LPGQRHQASDRENEADVDLRPLLRRQVDGDERTKAGLDVGDKENEPVQTAQAARRRRQRRFAATRLRAFRRGLFRDPAVLITTVAKAG